MRHPLPAGRATSSTLVTQLLALTTTRGRSVAVAAGAHTQSEVRPHELNVGENVGADRQLSCRVAVCLSGHIRSFVQPAVHESIRRNLVDAMREDGCEVDVFAYASRGDNVASAKKDVNTEYTPVITDVERSLAFLAPKKLVWHQEQAGIIPHSCARSSAFNDTQASDGLPDNQTNTWWEVYRPEASANLYWQLYKSLAAYRMALNEEWKQGGGFAYDWILRARFDVAWIRPIPSVRAFPREAAYFGSHYWPMSDHFALVHRSLSDRFFAAVSAFYSCNGPSWPPPESWWQPGCQGMGFEESVLFRHLHETGVPYRFYSMFEYVVVRAVRGGVCDLGASVYIHACNVLGLNGALRAPFASHDCINTLAMWASLRCNTLFAEGLESDTKMVKALVHPDPTAWEDVRREASPAAWRETPGSRAGQGLRRSVSVEDIDRVRSQLAVLRDAVIVEENSLPEPGSDELMPGRWQGWKSLPKWWSFSPHGCPLGPPQYPGRAPHLVMYYTAGATLRRELAMALKCYIHRLVDRSGGGDGDAFDWAWCKHARALELVMIDVSHHLEELGVCTADGSLGLSAADHIRRFFRDPGAHCVGYERL